MNKLKTCTKCSKTFPQTPEFFQFIKERGNFMSICRQCKNQRSKAYVLRKQKTCNLKEKKCPTCRTVYPFTDDFFAFEKSSHTGHSTYCRKCNKLRNTKYWINHPDKLEIRREKDKLTKQEYRKNNPNYYKKTNYLKSMYKYRKKKREQSSSYKLLESLRNRQREALKGLCKHKHTRELLGCSINEACKFIESKFQPGMAWQNWGSVWELDHIIPLAMFNLEDNEEQKFGFHYTNLQPLFIKQHKTKTIVDCRLIAEHKKCEDLLSWTNPNSSYYKDFMRK